MEVDNCYKLYIMFILLAGNLWFVSDKIMAPPGQKQNENFYDVQNFVMKLYFLFLYSPLKEKKFKFDFNAVFSSEVKKS